MEDLVRVITTTIQHYIFSKYDENINSEEVCEYFEIAENQKNTAIPLQSGPSRPGDGLQTVYYSTQSQEKITGCFTGFAYVTLEVESKEIATVKYDGHYPIVPFHCIFPFKNETIQAHLPEVGEHQPGKLNIAMHSQNVPNAPVARHSGNNMPVDSLNQMPMLLKASVFPKKTSEIVASLEEQKFVNYTILPSDNLQGYLTGKAGLIGKWNDRYIPFIIRIPQYENQHIPFCEHPCTVDIAACKIHEPKQCKKCSLKEALENLENAHKLQGPSELRELEGEVAMLNKGKIIKLAQGLSNVEFNIYTNDELTTFPCFQWKNDDPSIQDRFTLSGSPVFINQQGSMFFLGGMYTAETAFNGEFGLEIIRPEICEHFACDIIEKMKRQIQNERKQKKRDKLRQAVLYLEGFQKRMIILKENQITAWCDEIPLNELHERPQLGENGKIKCKVEFCINRH